MLKLKSLVLIAFCISFILRFPTICFANNTDVYDLTAEENITSPAVPAKASASIIRHMDGLAKTFTKHNFDVKKIRKGEVLCVYITSDILFAPNSTTLKTGAASVLKAFDALVKRPELYKLVILGHTDDTGDSVYSDNLSEVRANAVDEFFENMTSNANIIPYGMGADEPLNSNSSIENRRKNRRIEIYIIPTKQLIELASRGKLT